VLCCGNKLWIAVWKITAESVRRFAVAVVGAMARPAILRTLGRIRHDAAQLIRCTGSPFTPLSGRDAVLWSLGVFPWGFDPMGSDVTSGAVRTDEGRSCARR
jgi:hypothetical protein